MGMYDGVYSDYPLPVPPTKDGKPRGYQTKSLDCGMDTYFINADGRLIAIRRTFEPTPDDELPCKDAPEGSFERLFGSVRVKTQREEDTVFHGVLNIYDAEYDEQGNTTAWYELNLFFVYGKLDKIEPITGDLPEGVKTLLTADTDTGDKTDG
jgi:hypothetical protein